MIKTNWKENWFSCALSVCRRFEQEKSAKLFVRVGSHTKESDDKIRMDERTIINRSQLWRLELLEDDHFIVAVLEERKEQTKIKKQNWNWIHKKSRQVKKSKKLKKKNLNLRQGCQTISQGRMKEGTIGLNLLLTRRK